MTRLFYTDKESSIPVVSEDRIRYLALRLANMRISGPDRSELGGMAIELMVTRIRNEQLLEKTQSSKEKSKIEQILEQTRILEKKLVSLYLMTQISQLKPRQKFPEYEARKYHTPLEA